MGKVYTAIAVIAASALCAHLSGCSDSPGEVAAKKDRSEREASEKKHQELLRELRAKLKSNSGTPEENIRKAQEEGARALEQWDTAIRDNTADTRKKLEKAAAKYWMTNRNGVRVDTYVLKDGRSVICSTTIRGNSAAIMNCDGEP